MRVHLVATHPIQYHAPWFRALARALPELVVLFGCRPDAESQGTGFGVPFQWDVPLLDGYRWELLEHRGEVDLDRFFGLRAVGLAERLRAARPDALIVTGWNSWLLIQAARAAARERIPTLVRGDSNAVRRRPAWKRAVHRRFLRRYDAFLVVGSSTRAFYRAAGVPEERLFDVPHFVDNARFAEAAERARPRREELRREWGVPAAATCALFAGKLIPKKRPLDLLGALESLGSDGRSRHLLVVGDGELRGALERRARERGLPVTFAGFLNQSEIAAAYAAADLLVLPSDAGETWGLVVNEAMACGLPALVSDQVGSASDLVLAGETGATHRCGDVADLAAAWSALDADPARLARMGARARDRVFANHSLERAVAGTLAALRYVAGSA